MSDFVFFHNPDEENGYLSNWYLSDFEVDGVKFSSMEQYMMYSKAKLFNDEEIASEIMSTSDVAKIKSLGREVRNFDDSVWKDSSFDIISKGLFYKFSQNPDLREKLIGTGSAELAECAVKDTFWGIGLSMYDPRRFDKSEWGV